MFTEEEVKSKIANVKVNGQANIHTDIQTHSNKDRKTDRQIGNRQIG